MAPGTCKTSLVIAVSVLRMTASPNLRLTTENVFSTFAPLRYRGDMEENPPRAVVWGQRPYRITRIAVAVGLVIGTAIFVLRFTFVVAALLQLL